jgi:integrase
MWQHDLFSKMDSKYRLSFAKTSAGMRKDRDILMNVEVRAAFVELCKKKSGDDYVFASPKADGHLTEVKKGFKTALGIAGIEGLRWHDLRETFGTRLGEAGYDAFTIAQLMGHSDIRMTARYVRGTERNKRAAVTSCSLQDRSVTLRFQLLEFVCF